MTLSNKRCKLLLFSAVVLLWGAGHGLADDSLLFRLCLRGGDNSEATEESKSACRAYLARLMRGMPFDMVPTGQPFCIPSDDWTRGRLKLLLAKIKADNPNIREGMKNIIAEVVVTKARCSN
jgi:hypothetical protein